MICAIHVYGKQTPPGSVVRVREQRGMGDARVVDEHIDMPKRRARFAHHAGGVLRVGNIAAHGGSHRAKAGKLRDQRAGFRLRCTIACADPPASFGEAQRSCAPDAARSACDQNRFMQSDTPFRLVFQNDTTRPQVRQGKSCALGVIVLFSARRSRR